MNRTTILSITLLTLLIVATPMAYIAGTWNSSSFFTVGYKQGLTDYQQAADQAGYFSNVKFNDDGTVTVSFLDPNNNGAPITTTYRLDLFVEHIRNGQTIDQSIHAMSWTTIGLDWLADKIWNSAGTNATKFGMYISLSADATGFSAAWTALPAEIVANGCERALATWADTGTGTGTLSKSFSVTGSQSVQLYGLNYDTYANTPFGLVAAEQQGAGAVKNCLNGDTLAVTITCTASGA